MIVQATGPIHVRERLAEEELAGGTVEDVEKSVAVTPIHQLARAAVPVGVHQHGDLRGVIVVTIVGSELKIPFQFSGVRIERHNAVGIEIVAQSLLRVEIRTGIAGAPKDQVEIGIVGTRHPRRSAAMFPGIAGPSVMAGFAWAGDRIESPTFLAADGIIRGDESANAVLAAGHADHHLDRKSTRLNSSHLVISYAV